jgi:hypothetical protein
MLGATDEKRVVAMVDGVGIEMPRAGDHFWRVKFAWLKRGMLAFFCTKEVLFDGFTESFNGTFNRSHINWLQFPCGSVLPNENSK